MKRKRWIAFCLASLLAGGGRSIAQTGPASQTSANQTHVFVGQAPSLGGKVAPVASAMGVSAAPVTPGSAVSAAPVTPASLVNVAPAAPSSEIKVAQVDTDAPGAAAEAPPAAVGSPSFGAGQDTGQGAEESSGYGPYPIQKMHTLQNALRCLCGKEPLKDPAPKPPADPCAEKKPEDACAAFACPEKKDPCLKIFGWMDFDYTYRSTGSGNNPIAPVMNHYGNEFLNRQNGIAIAKVLDPNEFSWGFNSILIAGSDAAFLNPIKGWSQSADLGPGGSSRYSMNFTDLNLTAHLPILTDGGVDIKAGRQTTILGPMGALPFQRWFNSSDYAWYNMEEGRYTGVSSVWHVNKQLDWYNGFELGWGTFFAQIGNDVDYITNISYWLDEEAKKTKVWTTVLTGPTSTHSGKFTTTLELGVQHNWDERWYQIVDSQMVWSRGPVNRDVPAGYNERAYDVYTYLGYHLNKCVDLQTRFEWYYDQDGRNYAGGFGVPNTNYVAETVGLDYHPTKWVQFRPEIRYDHASNANFGENFNRKDQLSISADVLLKF